MFDIFILTDKRQLAFPPAGCFCPQKAKAQDAGFV